MLNLIYKNTRTSQLKNSRLAYILIGSSEWYNIKCDDETSRFKTKYQLGYKCDGIEGEVYGIQLI